MRDFTRKYLILLPGWLLVFGLAHVANARSDARHREFITAIERSTCQGDATVRASQRAADVRRRLLVTPDLASARQAKSELVRIKIEWNDALSACIEPQR